MKWHRQTWVDWPLRLYVAIMVSAYAVGKLAGGQFHLDPLPEELAQQSLGELSSFDLAWRFFGYSKVYIWIIGLGQLAGAALLLHRRTALLGIFTLLPILLNIIVVDLVFHIPGAATFNAIHYTGILIILLWLDRKRLLQGIRVLTAAHHPRDVMALPWRWLIGLLLATVLFLLSAPIGKWFEGILDK